MDANLKETLKTFYEKTSEKLSSDWNAAEGENGYVKNRTHWKEEGIVQGDYGVLFSGDKTSSDCEYSESTDYYEFKLNTLAYTENDFSIKLNDDELVFLASGGARDYWVKYYYVKNDDTHTVVCELRGEFDYNDHEFDIVTVKVYKSKYDDTVRVTVSGYGIKESMVYNKLDENYIPASIARTSSVYTKSEVDNLVAAKTNLQVVSALPTENISTTTIYLVLNGSSEEQNIYDEYIAIKQADDTYKWEKIGTTKTDVSGFLKADDFDENTITKNADDKLSTIGVKSNVVNISANYDYDTENLQDPGINIVSKGGGGGPYYSGKINIESDNGYNGGHIDIKSKSASNAGVINVGATTETLTFTGSTFTVNTTAYNGKSGMSFTSSPTALNGDDCNISFTSNGVKTSNEAHQGKITLIANGKMVDSSVSESKTITNLGGEISLTSTESGTGAGKITLTANDAATAVSGVTAKGTITLDAGEIIMNGSISTMTASEDDWNYIFGE